MCIRDSFSSSSSSDVPELDSELELKAVVTRSWVDAGEVLLRILGAVRMGQLRGEWRRRPHCFFGAEAASETSLPGVRRAFFSRFCAPCGAPAIRDAGDLRVAEAEAEAAAAAAAEAAEPVAASGPGTEKEAGAEDAEEAEVATEPEEAEEGAEVGEDEGAELEEEEDEGAEVEEEVAAEAEAAEAGVEKEAATEAAGTPPPPPLIPPERTPPVAPRLVLRVKDFSA